VPILNFEVTLFVKAHVQVEQQGGGDWVPEPVTLHITSGKSPLDLDIRPYFKTLLFLFVLITVNQT
jgi:hypothetical protein